MARTLRTRWLLGIAAAILAAACAPVAMQAGVERVEITERKDVLAGKSFGTTGPYEELTGRVFFAVDPANVHNRMIADLDKAPRNAAGKVEFAADLFILRPKDSARGNGALLFDVVNRGNKQVLRVFNRANGTNDPENPEDFGDGLLMNQGYTIVTVGWQFDVPKQKNRIGFDAPVATDNGKPITGWVSPWFIPEKKADSIEYAAQYYTPVYPPLDLNNPAYRLTVREGFVAAPRLIPRQDWGFGHMENGRITPDPNWVWVKGGFQPGETYQIAYETKNPPVAGLGFAAIRDIASYLKYDPRAILRGRYAYTYGSSQVGRFQRQMIYEGFTTDEQGRRAIDALFVQTGGTSEGSFNERFAEPNELGSFTQTKFPIRYEVTTDPVTGRRDGLGMRVPPSVAPKVFLVDTASEYWDRGRVAALRHTSLDGTEDLPDAPNVRIYFLTSTRHGPGDWPPDYTGGQLRSNPNDYRWAQRALLIALDGWVRKGTLPPPSQHPRLSDHTLVAQSAIRFPNIPGVRWPLHVPGGFRVDLRGAASVLPFLVPQVNSDGNEISGIRLPEQSVPLGTYTGWNFRSPKIGAPNTLIAMAGSYIPFAKTRVEREQAGDPRPSIEERYANRADYLQKVEAAAKQLARERYLLEQDVQPIVRDAGQHWDWTMTQNPALQSAK